MLDRKCEAFPDFGEMIGTLNRTVSKDEYKLLKDTFVPLMKYQVKHGAVPDEVFDQYGYPHNKDNNGKEYPKYGVCESYQRAKNISHTWQCNIHMEESKKLENESVLKEAEEIKKIQDLLQKIWIMKMV